MKQYEYNVVTNSTPLQERVLNRLGTEGWSLSSHTYSHFPHTPDRHVYTFKREVVEESVKKFKLDDSFKKRMEETVVSDTPAISWMDEYRGEYGKLLASGMFFEWHPTWTGEWDKDKYAFCHDRKYKKGSPQDPAAYSKIENAIIEWSNDGTQTAGELTRQILKFIK